VNTATATARRFEVRPQGPFGLENQVTRFGGWPRQGDAIVMAFPVEGWTSSAAVVLCQKEDQIVGEVHAEDAGAEQAWQQALAAISLDFDGRGFPDVGKRDPVIGGLQAQFNYLRPVLFHSPYEAACSFIIGHRIQIAQTRRIRQSMAEQHGRPIEVNGQQFHAFPDPRALLKLEAFPGVSSTQVERLHAAARAALDGILDRSHLRAMPEEEALAELRTLPGIGEFFAQGILMRGAGLVDAVSDNPETMRAVELLYGLETRPDYAELRRRAEAWRPFRMWTVVLLNVWLRSQPAEVRGPLRPGRPARRRS
jgi:DNA-3-methyladenine glycosylase II